MTPEALGRALAEAPSPELARLAVSRLGERLPARELLARPDIMGPATLLLGISRAASDFLVAHPEELEALGDLRPRTLDELIAEAERDCERLGPGPGLRRFRRRAGYRVAARDLSGADVEEVTGELSAVAEACLRAAAGTVRGAGELAVVGMGKLGGRELNYSSDVDVVFVHAERGSAAQERAGRAAAGFVQLLAEPTGEGVTLRVDANLRPEGRSGPLSRSLDSMLEYYERHAATWERQALLKARPVAGDIALGARFVEAVAPLVYPPVLAPSAIADVRATKVRAEAHVRALGKEDVEVKRGRGGIRDVEFAVQLLQLVHGRRHPRLRVTGTLEALGTLADEGFVGEADARALAESYRFLRRLEHRLQMVRDLQTHELPEDRAELGAIARSMGLGSSDRLRAEHARHVEVVRGLHERLFYRPLMEAFAGPSERRPGTDVPATEELLAGLGFLDAAAAYGTLARATDPSTRMGKVLGTLVPVVIPALTLGATPDPALVRFGRVVERLRDDRTADALADRPDAARRLAALVGMSSSFADALIGRPELAAALYELPTAERPLFPGDPESELLRVAAAYAAGDLAVPELGRRLAVVADQVAARALGEVGSPVPMAVIGVGRLGGEELSFGSDLDVMLVYEGEGRVDYEAAGAAAERVLSGIRSRGWRVDADLRPEGRAGPLARSMASYLEYWQKWAQTWEYQVLTRARFVAGDEDLGRRFVANSADHAYPEALPFERVADIRRMRVRMQEERVRPQGAGRFHFKLGYGGMADVQFAVELSLMRHGFNHPGVRRTNTFDALEALAAARLLEESVVRSLGEAYLLLSRVKNALEIEQRIPAEALPPGPEAQATLAARLGYEDRPRHSLVQEYMRVTWRARRAMERVFYGDDEA